MPLLDRLRPEQRAELRRLRKKIANRVFGVELPNRGRDVRAPRLRVRQDENRNSITVGDVSRWR